MSEPSLPLEPLQTLQVFHGSTSPMRGDVYARLPGLPHGGGYQLKGEVYGPFCRNSRTLPAKTELRAMGPGGPLLARAIVLDPCPWAADLPALYRVSVELWQHGQLQTRTECEFGFRCLGVSDGTLYRSGKPWQFRGLPVRTPIDWEAWRNLDAAMVVKAPTPEFCDQASQEGVPLVVLLDASAANIATEIQQLARCAAVFLIVLPTDFATDIDPRNWAPGTLFASFKPLGESLPEWASLSICGIDEAQRRKQSNDRGTPAMLLDLSFVGIQRAGALDAMHGELVQEISRFPECSGAVVSE